MSKEKIKLTESQKRKYIHLGGSSCPYCESPQIEGGKISIDGSTAWSTVHCSHCKMYWEDIYTLSHVSESK